MKITEQESAKKRKTKSLQELTCYAGTNKGINYLEFKMQWNTGNLHMCLLTSHFGIFQLSIPYVY